MNEQKLRRTTAISSFAFSFFCLLWVALSLLLLPVDAGQQDYSLMVTNPSWTFISSMGLAATLFGLFAVVGIYYANRARSGMLLFAGTVVLVLGLALEWAGLTWDVFIWPVICANDRYISFVREGGMLRAP